MGKKITMFSTESSSIQERFEQYLSAASAKGLSSKTLKTYRQHFHCISKHLDITVPLSSLSRAQVDAAIVSMRNSGLSANSISSYLRAFNSFLTWCRENGYSGLTVPNYKPKETVKETYSDSELSLLLKRPSASCSFVEYRSWVIVQFLLNSGCRAWRSCSSSSFSLAASNHSANYSPIHQPTSRKEVNTMSRNELIAKIEALNEWESMITTAMSTASRTRAEAIPTTTNASRRLPRAIIFNFLPPNTLEDNFILWI